MADDTTNHDLTFTIYALGDTGAEDKKAVPADIFAQKFKAFLAALREADRTENHRHRHDYFVTDLKFGSAEVTLEERPVARDDQPSRSSVIALMTCIDAIYRYDVPTAAKFNGLPAKIAQIAQGAGERFAYIELGRKELTEGVRADKIFGDQADKIVKEIERLDQQSKAARNFRGESFEGFDGYIKEVDLRGKTLRCKLVLADGTRELDCDFVDFSVDKIREHLDLRVWAEGTAIYNGEGGLPQRLQIRELRKMRLEGDLAKWRGALLPPKDVGDDWLV